MTELNASGANGLMDALGVNDYENGLLSGAISGTLGLDYQFSYNSSIKAQLPPLDLVLFRLDGSVEYRPTGFDGGAIRVTGSLKLPIVRPELVVRRTLDLESDNVTRDSGLSIALKRSKLFVGTFGDEDTELGFVASLSIESKSFPGFQKYVDKFGKAIEGSVSDATGGWIREGALRWTAGFSATLRVDLIKREDESFIDRRDSIIGTPGTDGYLGDKYTSNEVVTKYVNAYASGDLQKTAKVLVSGFNGVAITGDAGFYPDTILRKQAGYEGDVSGGGTQQESWNDKKLSGGGGGADSGKSGGSTPTKTTTTTSTKNDDGFTKTTTTTKFDSGVTQTTTKQTVITSAGPKEVTKTTTTPSPKPKDDPKKIGPQPILLDLDGNGVKITEYQNSIQFMTGKDGFQHRSSWAGAGDGVLFYDPDGRNAITEHRQYVFTEWNPTAAGDLEAHRSAWDTRGDGRLAA